MANTQTFYGWKLVAIFFLIYFLNASFPFYGGTVINAFMSESMGLDRSQLGMGFGLYVLCLGISGPLAGFLVGKFGVRKVLVSGSVLIAIGSLLMSFVASSYLHYLLIFGVLLGLAAPLGSMLPIQAGITYWFRRRKALALSIVLCASGIGALIAAPAVTRIVLALDGNWNAAWLLVAAASAIATLVAVLGVKDKPEELDQFPDGIDPQAAAGGEEEGHGSRVHQTSDPWTLSMALKTPTFWLIALASMAFAAPFNLGVAHGVVHFLDAGFSEELAGFSVGLVVMWSIVGRLLGGYLGDRIDLRFIWGVALLLVAMGMFAMQQASSVAAIHLYAISMGVGFGAAYVCLVTMIGNYYGAAAFGPVTGIMSVFISLSGALSPYLGGLVYDQLGSYSQAFATLILCALAGVLAIVAARPPVFAGEGEVVPS